MSQDWRIETNSSDYFAAQKKRLATDERRPAIRKASDLVGPGIAEAAVRITDFNDVLATFNGYFSAEPGALFAPNTSDSFIGSVINDATLGGVQEFTSLVSGNVYRRPFLRNPSDESSVSWSAWRSDSKVLDTLSGTTQADTPVALDTSTYVEMPGIEVYGNDPDTFTRTTFTIDVRPGVYTGYFWMRTVENIYIESVLIEMPNGDIQGEEFVINKLGASGIREPLNFSSTSDTGFLRMTARQTDITSATFEFRSIKLTRVGDV